MSTITSRLKKLRGEKGLKQIEVAALTGLIRATYANWETGRTEPDLDSVKLLAEFYEVTTDYLLGLTDDPTPPRPKQLNHEEYILSAASVDESTKRMFALYNEDKITLNDLTEISPKIKERYRIEFNEQPPTAIDLQGINAAHLDSKPGTGLNLKREGENEKN